MIPIGLERQAVDELPSLGRSTYARWMARVRTEAAELAALIATLGGAVPLNALRMIQFPLALITKNSVTLLPPNAYGAEARLFVQIGYTAGTTISLGTPTGVGSLMSSGENTATAPGLYKAFHENVFTGGVPVQAQILGAPIGGQAVVTIFYGVPSL